MIRRIAKEAELRNFVRATVYRVSVSGGNGAARLLFRSEEQQDMHELVLAMAEAVALTGGRPATFRLERAAPGLDAEGRVQFEQAMLYETDGNGCLVQDGLYLINIR